jgi:DNA-binding transcriptional regulator YdaS (Cro superfamily)
MKIKRPRDPGLEAAITASGTAVQLAAHLGITPQAINNWQRVPLARVADVERATGVPREVLRPDYNWQKADNARQNEVAA